jgi:uncharacterized protein (TIGR01244 family)
MSSFLNRTRFLFLPLGAILLLLFLGACCKAENPSTATEDTAAETLTTAPAMLTIAAPEALLPKGIYTAEGMLLGGQPTLEQLQTIHETGFRTVIDMRLAEEGGTTQADIEAAGMIYAALPIGKAEDVSEENARALAQLLESAEGPVVVHCKSGNRVGGLLALKAFYVDGATPEEALKLGLANGMTRTEPIVRERLGLPPAPASSTPQE